MNLKGDMLRCWKKTSSVSLACALCDYNKGKQSKASMKCNVQTRERPSWSLSSKIERRLLACVMFLR